MTEILQSQSRDNIWLQYASDEPLDDVADAIVEVGGAVDEFEERLSIIPTHVAFHEGVDDALAQEISATLGLDITDKPVMAYDNWWAVGIRDAVKKVSAISSHIDKFWYEEYTDEGDEGLGDLFVQFNPKERKDGSIADGATYRYGFVHADVYGDMLAAKSKGKFLSDALVENEYDYEKI